MLDPVRNMDNTVVAQCLEFTKQLISTKMSFKFSLSSGLYFNFTTMDQEPTRSRTSETKKKSSSTLRRNAARKQEFLKKRKSFTELPEDSFQCDQCDFKGSCIVNLRKHIL